MPATTNESSTAGRHEAPRRSRADEDAGTDDAAHAEQQEVPFAKRALELAGRRLTLHLRDRLAGEHLSEEAFLPTGRDAGHPLSFRRLKRRLFSQAAEPSS
jgi:hypothetical protein